MHANQKSKRFRLFEQSLGYRLAHLPRGPRYLADRSRDVKIAAVHNLVYDHEAAAVRYFRVANMETAVLGHSDCECCFPGQLKHRDEVWNKMLCNPKINLKTTIPTSSVSKS
jgi:hypothetical protein